ncbi:MAG: polysaccharide deacetylase family protein [Armatimonadota bacterium]
MTPRPAPIHPVARARPGLHFLVWHDIVARGKQVWFDTTRAEFAAQLERIAKAGGRPVSLEQARAWLVDGRGPLPAGAVVLCFDDNTVGIRDNGFALLRDRGWPFVLSVHTGYVGVRTGKDHNDWPALAEMVRGGATLSSQTVTHPPDLRTLSAKSLANEMTRSRETFAGKAGAIPFALTYPSGKWDLRVATAAVAAGYQLGLTEDHGVAETSPHALGVRRWSTHVRFDQAVDAIRRAAATR